MYLSMFSNFSKEYIKHMYIHVVFIKIIHFKRFIFVGIRNAFLISYYFLIYSGHY